MKIFCLARLYRRVIVRFFGGTKAFLLFVFAVFLSAYVIENYLLSHPEVVKRIPPESSVTVGYNTTISYEELHCGVKQVCPVGKYPYHIKSGYLEDGAATICFRGKYHISKERHGRGISIVVINEETLEVEDVQIFDTFEDDSKLRRYLQESVPDYRVVLITTEDEASKALQSETVALLHGFGSDAIHKLRFRENLAMVGQKGLTRGTAIEQYLPKSENRLFGEAAEVYGCLSVPVGRVFALNFERQRKRNESANNCGVTIECGVGGFPVRLYSGFENRELPKICIDGHYVMEQTAGRGINVIIFDPLSRKIKLAMRFDTYNSKCEELVTLLKSMKEGDLVIAVTHDEASTQLSDEIKKEFTDLGSSYVSRLAMRDMWAFVGQKGIKGRSTIEDLEFAPTGGQTWSNVIDMKICVPLHLKGFSLKFDAVVDKNVKRDNFCSRYVGYGEFCRSENRMELLKAAPLADPTMANSKIFNVPIAVIAGNSKNVLRQQLESVLALPGINPKNVEVFYNESIAEYEDLAALFGFYAFKVTNATSGNPGVLMQKALEESWSSDSEYLIVLDEEVLPTTDFLHFMDKCLDALDNDDSLLGASAWNDNGYDGPSSNISLLYRTEVFPGLGFLLKKSYYQQHMNGNWSKCCHNRSWEGWQELSLTGAEMIVPEVSRVVRQPYDGQNGPSEFLRELFNRRRTFSNGHPHSFANAGALTKILYEAELLATLRSLVALNVTDLSKCLATGSPESLLPTNMKGKTLAVFYEQNDIADQHGLFQLSQCFQLFALADYRVRGLHQGLLRFSYGDNQVFLIGSASKYYSLMPHNHQPMKRPREIAVQQTPKSKLRPSADKHSSPQPRNVADLTKKNALKEQKLAPVTVPASVVVKDVQTNHTV